MASSQQDEDWQSTKTTVLERSCHMFNNPLMSDIEFTCDGSEKKIFAHKYVLATSSSVFYKMFYGKLPETKPAIHLSNISEEGLEEFIRFIYTDECSLTTDNAVAVLYLAKEYFVPSPPQKCVNFLEAKLEAENAFTVVQQAIRFDEKELEKKSWNLIDLETNEAVASDAFTDINQEILVELLKRESLNVREVDLFKAVLKWSEAECSRKGTEINPKNKRDAMGNAIYEIRFASMTIQEFAQITSDSGLLTSDEMVLFYAKLGGVERASEVWNMSKRILLRCCRFVGHGILMYERKSFEHAIGISFSKQVKIHGIRLLGEAGKEFDVQLHICDQEIKKQFHSRVDHRGISGFDVMLPEPIMVQANDAVNLKATITGINQLLIYIGSGGKKTVETNGVTVNFFNIPDVYTGITTVEKGQFDQIIFSVI